jgi:hypothetical protein
MQWSHGRVPSGQDDVRCKCHQFLPDICDYARDYRGPAIVDLNVAPNGPAKFLEAKTSSASRWKTSYRRVILNMVNDDDAPRAPYKVYEGDECKGTYATGAGLPRASDSAVCRSQLEIGRASRAGSGQSAWGMTSRCSRLVIL